MKLKKIFTSILITMLVFLCFSSCTVQASFFDRDKKDTEIEKIIDDDERWTV